MSSLADTKRKITPTHIEETREDQKKPKSMSEQEPSRVDAEKEPKKRIDDVESYLQQLHTEFNELGKAELHDLTGYCEKLTEIVNTIMTTTSEKATKEQEVYDAMLEELFHERTINEQLQEQLQGFEANTKLLLQSMTTEQ